MFMPVVPSVERSADDDVVDLAAVDACPLDAAATAWAPSVGAVRVVQRSPVGLADGRAGNGDDDCFSHRRCRSRRSPQRRNVEADDHRRRLT